MDEEPEIGMRPEGGGIGPVNREKGGGPYGVVLLEKQIEHTSEPTLQDLSEALVAAYGTDFGVHSPTWISRFTDMTRQAASYRQGRVLLAGDAAHVHGPQGGQGLNTGVQDAVNLGWKLAQVVNKTSPESLLDTYHAERHPVGARVLHNTMAQVALSRIDERSRALRDTMLELLSMDEPRRRIAGMISGLDIHYDLGEGHPLLGRRMPDLDLDTADGPTRVFTLLHDARPVLLNLGEPGGFDISPWANRVRLVDAKHDGVWELPVLGEIAAPSAVLIRPDGYVAWAGDLTDPELPQALATWFGAAAPATGIVNGRNGQVMSQTDSPIVKGTVTILFTDLEGSTDLRLRVGDTVANEVIQAHDDLVRSCLETAGGANLKSLGDGFMALFTSANQAIEAAISIQQAVEQRNQSNSDLPISVRIGLNSGDVTQSLTDAHGTAVHAASRIADKAQGGQILISQLVHDLAGTLNNARLVDRGLFWLKGFPERWRLFEILWRDKEHSNRITRETKAGSAAAFDLDTRRRLGTGGWQIPGAGNHRRASRLHSWWTAGDCDRRGGRHRQDPHARCHRGSRRRHGDSMLGAGRRRRRGAEGSISPLPFIAQLTSHQRDCQAGDGPGAVGQGPGSGRRYRGPDGGAFPAGQDAADL